MSQHVNKSKTLQKVRSLNLPLDFTLQCKPCQQYLANLNTQIRHFDSTVQQNKFDSIRSTNIQNQIYIKYTQNTLFLSISVIFKRPILHNRCDK